jgi:hypothetical protein
MPGVILASAHIGSPNQTEKRVGTFNLTGDAGPWP